MEKDTTEAELQNCVCDGSNSGEDDACTNNVLGVETSCALTGEREAAVKYEGTDVEQEWENEKEEDGGAGHVLHNSRSPDGGWGWMVALGSFLLSALIHSVPYCFGILFSGFLLENGASSTTTAWIYNLFMVSFHISLLLMSPLCHEFGQRTVGFTSVLMVSLSVILSGFAPSVYFLYFSFSMLAGFTSGLSVGIAFSVLPPYFDKNSGKANTLLVTGDPVSYIIFAPLLRYLLDMYSLKGASLIQSAILLNGLVAVSFFHPIKWHLKPLLEKTPQMQRILKTFKPHEKSSSTASSSTPQNALLSVPCSFLTSTPHSDITSTSRGALASSVSKMTPRDHSVSRQPGSLSRSVSSMASGKSEAGGETSTRGTKPRGRNALWRTLVSVAERMKSDVGVLRQYRCAILAVTVTLTHTANHNFIMMVPFVANAANHSLEDAANCIALLGVTNLVTRLVVSPLSDWRMFSIRLSIMLGYFLKALGITVAMLSSELSQLMASGAMFGIGLGLSLSMFNPVIVHYMGVENLRPTIGIIGLAGAIGFPILGPLIGLIRDVTNSYIVTLCVLVTLDLLSVCLWLLMPAAQARDARRKLQVNTSREATRL